MCCTDQIPPRASNKSSIPRPSPKPLPAVVLDRSGVGGNVSPPPQNETGLGHQSQPFPANSTLVGWAEGSVNDAPELGELILLVTPATAY
jgi:hypothetical protein